MQVFQPVTFKLLKKSTLNHSSAMIYVEHVSHHSTTSLQYWQRIVQRLLPSTSSFRIVMNIKIVISIKGRAKPRTSFCLVVLALFILLFYNPGDFSSASDMLSKNRTLVIVTGSPRGGELAWKSLYKNVLDVNQADLAVFFGTSKNRTSSLYDRAKYVWEFEEYDDWGEAMDLINGTAWRDTLPYALPNHSTWIRGAKLNVTYIHPGSGAVVLMIRWFLMKKMEKLNIMNMYDQFVVTRSDHFYLCKHDLSLLDPGYVWVPQGEDYGGITDRYVIANSNGILKTLDVYPALLTSPYRYINHPEMKNFNPEELLKVRWEENGLMQRVKRFERVMFTCWVDGDSSRGYQSIEMTPEGVKLKCKLEYKQSKATCAKAKDELSLHASRFNG